MTARKRLCQTMIRKPQGLLPKATATPSGQSARAIVGSTRPGCARDRSLHEGGDRLRGRREAPVVLARSQSSLDEVLYDEGWVERDFMAPSLRPVQQTPT